MQDEKFPPRVWFTEDLEDNFCGSKAPSKYTVPYLSVAEHESLTKDLVKALEKIGNKQLKPLSGFMPTEQEIFDDRAWRVQVARQALSKFKGEEK